MKKRTNTNKVLFRCDDVELLDNFDKFCLEQQMNRSSMLRKFMYEAVGQFKKYDNSAFLSQLGTR